MGDLGNPSNRNAVGVSALVLGSIGLAHAQDEHPEMLDGVQVTGSRVKRADIESASPVFVIEREEIERTGLTSVGDLLQNLFDKDPPVSTIALADSYNRAEYRVPGVLPYLRVTVDF